MQPLPNYLGLLVIVISIWNSLTNEKLWKKKSKQPILEQLRRRKWNWIEHTLRRSDDIIAKQVLQWMPQGRRGRGRPRNTWKKDLERKILLAASGTAGRR